MKLILKTHHEQDAGKKIIIRHNNSLFSESLKSFGVY